jgi:hypothetical protein
MRIALLIPATLSLALAPPPARAQQPTPEARMSLDDFVLDKAELGGRRVAVAGTIACIGGADICYLFGAQGFSMNAFASFKASGLSRDDRKRLLGCDAIMNKCPVVLHGKATADKMPFNDITALTIEWVQ